VGLSGEALTMVQIQAISQRTTQQAELLFRQRAAELRSRIAGRIVDAIIDASPVDTGTYTMAHVAGAGESSEAATRSSTHPVRKPRGRNREQFVNLARGNLRRSVSAAAIMASNEIWFRNRSLHAGRVEYTGWPAPLFGSQEISGPGPYRVYAKARAMVPTFIREEAAAMGMTAR
jgi:hypothetical protein